MVLDISQELPFWVTVEVSCVFLFFFHVVIRLVAKGLNSCQRRTARVRGTFVVAFDFLSAEAPLVHFDSTWIKMLFSCILSCLFFALDLSYSLPHLTEPVESSQNQSHNHFRSAKQDKKQNI